MALSSSRIDGSPGRGVSHGLRASQGRDRQGDRRPRRDRPRRLDLPVHRRARAPGRRAGPGQDAAGADARRRGVARLQPHPVHARPDARRHHRHQHRHGAARRPPRFRVPARPGLLADRAGRRDQSRHAQDPVGPARGDAGALGHGRRPHPPAQGAVLRDGDPEPDRAGRDLSACPRRSSTGSCSS